MHFGYSILYVPEVPKTVAFYEAAFGLQRRFLHESGDYAEMETGATTLAFAARGMIAAQGLPLAAQRQEGQGHHQEIGLVTDDVAAAYARALAAGALPVQAPSEKPWGQTVAYVQDSDGFLIELCTPVSG